VTADRDDWDDHEREALSPIARELADLRARHRNDPPLDLLRAAHADALPDSLLEPARAHLESSAWSRALVDGADLAEVELDAAAIDRLLARTQRTAMQETGGRRRRWVPLFAVAAAAALVVAFIVWRNAVGPAPLTTVADNARRSVAPSPSSPREFRLELTKPAVKLTAAALVLRGDRNSARFVDDVADGLNAYRAGDYEKAARDLDALQSRYPGSVEIPFYAGISRLMSNDPPGAVRALEAARALNDDTFADDVAWYLAVAYERAGEVERARPLLDALCRGSGTYTARACAAAGTFR
jgi:tetratricopeptide (TPR) repeat protein